MVGMYNNEAIDRIAIRMEGAGSLHLYDRLALLYYGAIYLRASI